MNLEIVQNVVKDKKYITTNPISNSSDMTILSAVRYCGHPRKEGFGDLQVKKWLDIPSSV